MSHYHPLADQKDAAMYQQQNPYGQQAYQPGAPVAAAAGPPGGYVSPPPQGYGQPQQPMMYAPPAVAGQYQPQQQYQPSPYQQQPPPYQQQQQQQQQYQSQPIVYVQPQHQQQQVVYAQPGYASHPQAPVANAVHYPQKETAFGGGTEGMPMPAPQHHQPAHPHGGLIDNPARFENAPHNCRDLIWSVIFLAHFIAICVIAGVMWSMYKHELSDNNKGNDDYNNDSNDNSNQNELKFDGRAAGILGIVVGGSFIMSAMWLDAFKRWSNTIIWVCLCASPVFFFAIAMLFIVYLDNIIAGVIFILCALLNALYVYLVRSRIAFSATILTIVVQVLQSYPVVTLLAFGAIMVQVLWIFIWVIAAAGCMHSFRNQEKTTVNPDGTTTTTGNSDAVIGVVWFVLVLSFFWTMQVIKNVVHVMTAGVVATWSALKNTKHAAYMSDES